MSDESVFFAVTDGVSNRFPLPREAYIVAVPSPCMCLRSSSLCFAVFMFSERGKGVGDLLRMCGLRDLYISAQCIVKHDGNSCVEGSLDKKGNKWV